MSEYYAIVYSNSLYHHGVKGMKWGVRKQQIVSTARRYGKAAKPYIDREIYNRNLKYRNRKGNISIGRVAGHAIGRTAKKAVVGIGSAAAASALLASGHPIASKILLKAGSSYIASKRFEAYADYGALAFESYRRYKKKHPN